MEIDDTKIPPLQVVRQLLDQAGFPEGGVTLDAIAGGGNNRVFRAALASRQALLKVYFRHALDPRDRLRSEFAFTRFAWQQGIQQVPRPLACDAEHGLGLYEFIEGRKLSAGEVNDKAVSQALAFCRALNQHRRLPEAQGLPAGSEACFCLADHWHCVERRLARCDAWQPACDIDRAAQAFVKGELRPRWRHFQAQAQAEAERIGIGPLDVLPAEARCLSPSDFGFHNALLEPSSRLRFIDFEYAGWDDPAKLACDFFCQPALPVPAEFWDRFVGELSSAAAEPGLERRRMELLLPIYRVKWVTILLNDFHPAGNDRRRFARPEQDADERKAKQLAKAQALLATTV